MNNKFLRCFMVTAAIMVSVGVYSPMTVYAGDGWVQACEEGAPVEHYHTDDVWTEETVQKTAQGYREMGMFSESEIQQMMQEWRVKYGLASSAPAQQTTPAKTETKKAEHSYTQEQIDAAWEEVSRTEATCTDGAVATYKNSLTGKTKTENVSEALGHKYEEAVTEATCVADGKTVYTCSACGDSYEETLPAHGHMAGEPVVTSKAGLFVEGKTVVSCTSCGEVLEVATIPQTSPISLESAAFILGAFFVAVAALVRAAMVRKKKEAGKTPDKDKALA